MTVAFKLQYGINHMLQYLGAGNAAVRCNVTNKKYRCIGLFGKALELCSGFAYLGYASG